MYRSNRPFLMLALLVAIGLRAMFGAPCCMASAEAASPDTVQSLSHHSAMDHDDADHNNHSGHDDANTANPCCSACGPTLPPDLVQLAASQAPRALPAPAPIRALATRPPYPAYEATGPPLLT